MSCQLPHLAVLNSKPGLVTALAPGCLLCRVALYIVNVLYAGLHPMALFGTLGGALEEFGLNVDVCPHGQLLGAQEILVSLKTVVKQVCIKPTTRHCTHHLDLYHGHVTLRGMWGASKKGAARPIPCPACRPHPPIHEPGRWCSFHFAHRSGMCRHAAPVCKVKGGAPWCASQFAHHLVVPCPHAPGVHTGEGGASMWRFTLVCESGGRGGVASAWLPMFALVRKPTGEGGSALLPMHIFCFPLLQERGDLRRHPCAFFPVCEPGKGGHCVEAEQPPRRGAASACSSLRAAPVHQPGERGHCSRFEHAPPFARCPHANGGRAQGCGGRAHSHPPLVSRPERPLGTAVRRTHAETVQEEEEQVGRLVAEHARGNRAKSPDYYRHPNYAKKPQEFWE
ncbi:hypothetical protein EDB83DRAFT_2558943 [Lactarius deliciosus]|nr:hypothetical protein EDB83DRAFT_2558943 [Lactarius deliciosus]